MVRVAMSAVMNVFEKCILGFVIEVCGVCGVKVKKLIGIRKKSGRAPLLYVSVPFPGNQHKSPVPPSVTKKPN